MKQRHVPAIVLACALLALGGAGCGGSSSSSSVRPSANLVTETVGNTWNYTITGVAVPTAGGAQQAVTGTATAVISTSNVNGSALALTLTSNVSLNGASAVPISVVYYVTQNDTGDLIEYATSRTDSSGTTTLDVTTPSLANSELFPGTFTQGETINETIDYNGGSSQAYDLEVVQPAQASTTAGSFATWEVNLELGGAPLGTQYWDPAIGMFVKGTVNAQAYIGATQYNLSINYSLTNYTLTSPV